MKFTILYKFNAVFLYNYKYYLKIQLINEVNMVDSVKMQHKKLKNSASLDNSKIDFSVIARVLRSKDSTKEEKSLAAAKLGSRGGIKSHSGDGKKSRTNNEKIVLK
jgi:hypothetical protein